MEEALPHCKDIAILFHWLILREIKPQVKLTSQNPVKFWSLMESFVNAGYQNLVIKRIYKI